MKKNSPLTYCYLDVVIAFFAAVLITSNVASSAKIIDLRFSVLGLPLAFDGGTLLFPVSYVIGDLLTEVYGFKIARRAIWTGFAVLAVSALLFFLLRALPGEASWESYAGQASYDAILGGMSSGGIAAASLFGYLTGNFSNSIVLSRMKVIMKGRLLWVRTVGSSVVGELLDSLVFVAVACFAGVFPRELFVTLVVTNYALKLSVEILVSPVCCLLSRRLKKAEALDVYDKGISYNPFLFG